MWITRLTLSNFRHFSSFEMYPHHRFNLIIGENGTGKTSILEAIYFLGSARSHRTNQLARIIQEGVDAFTLFTEIETLEGAHHVGLNRTKQGEGKSKLNGKIQPNHIEIAQLLPILMFNPESFSLLTEGSKGRRQLLDWGIFHQSPEFYPAWHIAKKVLAHRNAMLKSRQTPELLQLFDQQLISASEKIDSLREDYVAQLMPIVTRLIGDFLARHDVHLQYFRGWSKEDDLADLLKLNLRHDQEKGYTQAGPHRADLRLRVGKIPAQDILSRGQQKLLICAIKLAQGILFEKQTGRKAIYLLDDIGSELDDQHRQHLLGLLKDLKAQVFATGIRESDFGALDASQCTLFRLNAITEPELPVSA